MTSIINPYTVMISFALFLIILGWFKPQITRIIIGCFFFIMAFVVNLPLAINNPGMFVEAGRNAFFPVYQWFFTEIIAWNPPVFIYPLIAFETSVGLLILSKGRAVRYGLILATLFCYFIAPIGVEAVTSPALVLLLHYC